MRNMLLPSLDDPTAKRRNIQHRLRLSAEQNVPNTVMTACA